MSIKTKKRFKNLAKIIGGALFALLMFTNIKLALLDDNEIASGDISVLGIELTLFDATYATGGGTGIDCAIAYSCITEGHEVCSYMYNNPGPGGYYCFYIIGFDY